jgi:hypothetical protein
MDEAIHQRQGMSKTWYHGCGFKNIAPEVPFRIKVIEQSGL